MYSKSSQVKTHTKVAYVTETSEYNQRNRSISRELKQHHMELNRWKDLKSIFDAQIRMWLVFHALAYCDTLPC